MKKVSGLLCCAMSLAMLSGCAGSPYILRAQQKTFALNPNSGMVLFTARIGNSTGFRMNIPNYSVQEINQYKDYKSLSTYLIPLVPENNYGPDGALACTLILPAGRYKINSFQGIIISYYQYQCTVLANMYVFDVLPGTVTYAGRLNYNIYAAQGGVFEPSGMEDLYDREVASFRSIYSALQDKKIVKELFY
jgi:hypothetical protein